MNVVFEIGFFMGLIGSIHCIGMCGPLVMALPISQQTNFQKWQSILLYNAGKISSYSLLGIIFGLFGSQLPLYGVQENLSIVMGSIMILYVVYVFVIKPKFISRFLQFNLLYTFIVKNMGQLFQRKNRAVFYLIGILNGLLPCGMIYVALTSAIAAQNIMQGGFIMAFFGLGTMPALIMVAIGGQYFGIVFRKKIQSFLPVFIFSMGVLLILRGMHLGIPYVSPHLRLDKISCHN
jgi:sulfite exporter TauE/SafE